MASAGKQDFDLDDDFDFDADFDFDDVPGMGELPPPKNAREAITRSAAEGLEGAKDHIKNLDSAQISKLLNNALPPKLQSELSKATGQMGGLSEQLDKTAKEAKAAGKSVTDLLKTLGPKGGKIESMLNKLSNKLSDDMSSWQDSAEERLRAGIESELQNNFTKEATLTLLTDQHQEERSKNLISAINKLNDTTGFIKNFHLEVTNNFYRKSLEIQYKHLFATQEHANFMKSSMETMKGQFSELIRNSSLPDIVKITNKEIFEQVKKQKLFNKLDDALFGGTTKAFERIAGNIGNYLQNNVQAFLQTIGGGAEGLNSAAGMLADGPGAANMAGGQAAQFLMNQMTKVFGKTFGKTKAGQKLQEQIARGLADPKTTAKNLQSSLENNSKGGIKGKLGRGLGSALGWFNDIAFADSETAKSAKFDTSKLGEPAIFDHSTQMAITKVIPGYLNAIYSELKTSRIGGDPEHNKMYFNAANQSFQSGKELAKFYNTKHTNILTQNVKPKVNDLVKNVNGYVKAKTQDEINELGVNLFTVIGKSNHSVSLNTLNSNAFFSLFKTESMRNKVKSGIQKLMEKASKSPDTFTNLTNQIIAVREALPGLNTAMEQMGHTGTLDIGVAEGMFEKTEDGYTATQHGTMDYFAKLYGGTDPRGSNINLSKYTKADVFGNTIVNDVNKSRAEYENSIMGRVDRVVGKGVDLAKVSTAKSKLYLSTKHQEAEEIVSAQLGGEYDPNDRKHKLLVAKELKDLIKADGVKAENKLIDTFVKKKDDTLKLFKDNKNKVLNSKYGKKATSAYNSTSNYVSDKAKEFGKTWDESEAKQNWDNSELKKRVESGKSRLGKFYSSMKERAINKYGEFKTGYLDNKESGLHIGKDNKHLVKLEDFLKQNQLKVEDVTTAFVNSEEFRHGGMKDITQWLYIHGIKPSASSLTDSIVAKAKKYAKLNKAVTDDKAKEIQDKAIEAVAGETSKDMPADDEGLKQVFFESNEYKSGAIKDFNEWKFSLRLGNMSHKAKNYLKNLYKKRGLLGAARALDRFLFKNVVMKPIGKALKYGVKLPAQGLWWGAKNLPTAAGMAAKGAAELAMAPVSQVAGLMGANVRGEETNFFTKGLRSIERNTIAKTPGLMGGALGMLSSGVGYGLRGLGGIGRGIDGTLRLAKGQSFTPGEGEKTGIFGRVGNMLGGAGNFLTTKKEKKTIKQRLGNIFTKGKNFIKNVGSFVGGMLFKQQPSLAEEVAKDPNASTEAVVMASGFDRVSSILMSLVPKKKANPFDKDGDGNREGSWMNRLFGNKKKSDNTKDQPAKDDKKDGGFLSKLGGFLMPIFGTIIGGTMSMLGAGIIGIGKLLAKGIFGSVKLLTTGIMALLRMASSGGGISGNIASRAGGGGRGWKGKLIKGALYTAAGAATAYAGYKGYEALTSGGESGGMMGGPDGIPSGGEYKYKGPGAEYMPDFGKDPFGLGDADKAMNSDFGGSGGTNNSSSMFPDQEQSSSTMDTVMAVGDSVAAAGLAADLAKGGKSLFGTAKEKVGNAATKISEAAKNGSTAAKATKEAGFFAKLCNKVITFFRSKWGFGWIADKIEALYDVLKKKVGDLLDKASNWVNKFKGWMNTLKNSKVVKKIGKSAAGKILTKVGTYLAAAATGVGAILTVGGILWELGWTLWYMYDLNMNFFEAFWYQLTGLKWDETKALFGSNPDPTENDNKTAEQRALENEKAANADGSDNRSSKQLEQASKDRQAQSLNETKEAFKGKEMGRAGYKNDKVDYQMFEYMAKSGQLVYHKNGSFYEINNPLGTYAFRKEQAKTSTGGSGLKWTMYKWNDSKGTWDYIRQETHIGGFVAPKDSVDYQKPLDKLNVEYIIKMEDRLMGKMSPDAIKLKLAEDGPNATYKYNGKVVSGTEYYGYSDAERAANGSMDRTGKSMDAAVNSNKHGSIEARTKKLNDEKSKPAPTIDIKSAGMLPMDAKSGEFQQVSSDGSSGQPNGKWVNEAVDFNMRVNKGKSIGGGKTERAGKLTNSNKTGQCARYVRESLTASGAIPKGVSLGDAWQFNQTLPKYGFSKVEVNPMTYKPLKGDIAVIDRGPKGYSNPQYGHVTMYTGKEWVSDYIQRNTGSNTAMSPYKIKDKDFLASNTTIWRKPDEMGGDDSDGCYGDTCDFDNNPSSVDVKNPAGAMGSTGSAQLASYSSNLASQASTSTTNMSAVNQTAQSVSNNTPSLSEVREILTKQLDVQMRIATSMDKLVELNGIISGTSEGSSSTTTASNKLSHDPFASKSATTKTAVGLSRNKWA